jgi:hypothetical protein
MWGAIGSALLAATAVAVPAILAYRKGVAKGRRLREDEDVIDATTRESP